VLAQHKLAILCSLSEEKAGLVQAAKMLLTDVFKGMHDVSVLARVAVSQVRVLKQLRKLLGNSTPLVSEDWKPWPHLGSRRYVADVVRVPTVRMLLEQLPLVLWMIDETVDECKQLAHAVQDLQAPVRVSCDLVGPPVFRVQRRPLTGSSWRPWQARRRPCCRRRNRRTRSPSRAGPWRCLLM